MNFYIFRILIPGILLGCFSHAFGQTDPSIRYYEDTQTAALEDDLVAALDGDVFILTSPGGNYTFGDWVNISAKVTIMAAEDLVARPVLSIYKESNTVQILRLYADGSSITVTGIEFNSGSREPGSWPNKYAIRTNPLIGNYSLTAIDCYFRGTWRSNDNTGTSSSNGAAVKLYNGTHGDSIIFRHCIFEGDEGIVLNNTGDPFGWDKFEITNCTFMDMPGDQAILIAQRGENKNLPLKIDHCTFNNVGGIGEELIITDSLYTVELSNSIFGTTTADISWHLFGETVNKTMVDYVNFFECPEALTDEGGLLGSNRWTLDPMFADTANGDLTLGNAALLNLGSDGLPLGDLRWADVIAPKVQSLMASTDTTLIVKFDEWIDTTTAEISDNYTLSGSAGYTGNVKGAELYNFNSVLLTIESFSDKIGQEITVRVSNVEDLKGNVVDPAHDSATYLVVELGVVVTAAEQSVSNASAEVAIARSNKTSGFIYLILDGEAQSSIAELDAAVAAKKGASAAVTLANTDTEIDVSGIEPGTYYAYAIDGSSNMSEKGTNAISVNDGIPPIVSTGLQTIHNGADDFALVQSNEKGRLYIIKDGIAQATEDDFLNAINISMAAKADVITASRDVQVPSKDLITGIYFAYAVDAAGNISLKSKYPINIVKVGTLIVDLNDAAYNVYSINGMIHIESPGRGMDRVSIFDLKGRTVINQIIRSEHQKFLIEKQGIYIVRLSSDKHEVKTFKLVVQ